MRGKSKTRGDYERTANKLIDYYQDAEDIPMELGKEAAEAILDLCLMVWGSQGRLIPEDPPAVRWEDVETGDNL